MKFLKKLFFYYKLRKANPKEKALLYKSFYNLKMGENCKIFGKVDFGSEPYLISLGNNVMISDNVHFVNHDGGIQVFDVNGWLPDSDIFGRICVGNNVFIGRDTVLLKDVRIEDNVVIGAGAVITKDCKANSVYAGIPAKRIKSLTEYYENVKEKVDFTLKLNPEEKKKYLLNKYNIED